MKSINWVVNGVLALAIIILYVLHYSGDATTSKQATMQAAGGTKVAYFEIDSIPCIMERSHGIYLMGMEVDWQGGLNSRGFTFKNPNASTTCGCGTSFAV